MTVSITPRLRQLLLLLSSNQPGEVAAAAAAITRVLERTGASWHDLADGLLSNQRDAASREAPSWQAMRTACLAQRARLRARELEFLDDIGSWCGDLTEKQHSWLAAIYARLHRQ